MSTQSAGYGVVATTGGGVGDGNGIDRVGDYRHCIDVVTSYIHSHINGELQLERLAGLAGFSPFHFHRIFAALMGETVAEYVRRVRLAAAVQRLLHSTEPVTGIALAVGYETPAAFAKAFR
ncbi:MAG: AraC family transcriptional regulator, partial [Chloroflexi bacterium]|nr:AraC family transcriptional regulator [Chloroflexota bacterium]